MKATIITIGDEILIGQIVDTNSASIARHLNAAGIVVAEKESVGDDRDAIVAALRRAMDSVSSLLGTPSDAPSPPPDDVETRLLPVLSGIMQGGRAAVNPDKRALMTALRPFIAQDVALQFDRALRLVGMAGMARAALSELEHRTGKGGDSAV